MLLNQNVEEQNDEELMEMLINNPIAYDVDSEEEKSLTFGEKVADKISEKAGSWGFILGFLIFLIGWIILNAIVLNKGIDPYPFILLNLVLSCIAALQAPIIMMSQNRQAKKDSLRNKYDYHIDLKSELLLEELYKNQEQLIANQNKIIKYIETKENENK